MGSTPSDKPHDTDLSTQLAYLMWFNNVIGYLESEGCAPEDLATEARKKIGEATELIAAAAEGHDKDKQDKVKDLVKEVGRSFFAMLDYCYNKYAGPRMSQMSKSQG